MSDGTVTQILIMIILIILSAYFSATETAFSSLSQTRLKTLAEKGRRKAALAYRLGTKYDKLLSTILIGNNIVNIAAASMGTIIFVRIYGDIGATISTIVITIAVLIFGEITPKIIAKDCPERFAMFSAPIINVFIQILTPLNFIFSCWKKLITKILKLDEDKKISQDELLMIVDEVQQDGSIDKNEGELLKNAIEFTDREAEDILTHRVDLEAVPITATKMDIAKSFSDSKFSRILVYDKCIDNIVGVIHLKDFYTGEGITKKDIKDILTPAVFVLRSEKISAILKQLQQKKSHVAVVLDEYGGTYGIVTMEDILEELVGEIWDEHDDANEIFKEINTDTYTVDANVDIDDFCDFFNIKIETESPSMNGWIMEELGQLPCCGDCFDYDGLCITILSTDYHRVSEIEVRRLTKNTSTFSSRKAIS